ncbi:MAG TPA: pyridoxal kinase [Ferrovibrio sp.]|jgi:pyridoxine kinase|uniref:pyridoxal kinase n=1 Tax=Ferrovibrio sp. TaxID=1917215 RepID=UPI002ED6B241
MRVLAIQSQVIFGHVGNNAGAFALQRQGVETWAVPTAILAFNPSYGPPAMRATEPAEMDAWMMALQTRPEWRQIDAILLGWLGNPKTAEAAARAALAAKAANPDALLLCDPVMGDSDCGLYVDAALPPFIRDQLVPKADIATPNGFELEFLLGRKVEDLPSALAACDALRAQGPKTVIATTLRRRDGGSGMLEALLVNDQGAWLCGVPDLGDLLPKGAGDVFAALFLARLLKGRTPKKALLFAMAGTYGLLRDAQEHRSVEMRMAAAQEELHNPTCLPDIERVR